MTSLRQLQYFVTVAEEGQLTRAAQRLHLSQPALSQAIAQLESQLGVELLVRHARGVGLTPAGEAFFDKARTAVTALSEVDLTAGTLSRAAKSSLVCGFVGVPPTLEAPELFDAFTLAHPDIEISYRELSFPGGTTASWLEQVDVALYFAPTEHPEVETELLRYEPRVVVMARTHPLAERSELAVADVLEETFCGTHPACEPVRSGFWRLDDHRGGAGRVSADRAMNPQEVLSVVATGRALWTAAASTSVFLTALPAVVAVPLSDASPVALSLAWRGEQRNPQVSALARMARTISDVGAHA
jgi:DNA-binding transcriptional LysR family regulator